MRSGKYTRHEKLHKEWLCWAPVRNDGKQCPCGHRRSNGYCDGEVYSCRYLATDGNLSNGTNNGGLSVEQLRDWLGRVDTAAREA